MTVPFSLWCTQPFIPSFKWEIAYGVTNDKLRSHTFVAPSNTFIFFNLPSAWWTGVRVVKITSGYCEVKVRLQWINKNPFKSMFWAIQGMAAELSTGVLLMKEAKDLDIKISMLVINNKANFTKKAKGKLVYSCRPINSIRNTFKNY